MRFNILYKKSVTFLALFILVACGGGSSSPTLLTWPSFSAFEVVENSNGSWSIAATINKGAQISYAIEPSADSGSFALSGSALSLNLSPNYEQPLDANKDGVYELVLSAKSLGQTATRSINVRVTDISEAPIISTLSIDNISENLAVISTIEAFDEDANSSILFSLIDSAGSKDEDLLSIDSKSGALTFKITPNYEIPSDLNLDNTINFSVLVSDGSLSTQSDYSFSIIDINEAPLISTDTIDAIFENTSYVTTIWASDPDINTIGKLSFTLKPRSTAVDDIFLSIDESTGKISFISPPDFENPRDQFLDNVYNFTVEVSDGTLSTSKNFSIVVQDDNEAPFITSSSSFSIPEGTNAVVGFVTASDQDSSDSITYSLCYEGCIDDSDRLQIDSSTGAISFLFTNPNYENPLDDGLDNTYDITVIASDGILTASQRVSVTVGDVNESPRFGATSSQVYGENTNSFIPIQASDPEGSIISYSISGVDARKFSIASNGTLTFTVSPDFETPLDLGLNNVYNITVTAFDGVNYSSISLAIQLTDDLTDNFGIKLPGKVAIAELKKES